MAKFGQLTGKAKARSEKLRKRIESATTRAGTVLGEVGSAAEAVVKSTAKFLAAFGSEVVRLNKLSTKTLSQQDPVQQTKLRERAVAEVQAQTKAELKAVMERYARGKITLDTFRSLAEQTLRRGALAAAIIGTRGVGNLTENVLTAVQRQLSAQFEQLDGFINELSTRELIQRDRARFLMYANKIHTISQTATRQFTIDMYGDNNSTNELEERRFLGGAEHCDDCIELAAEGWVPAGSLPPIGTGTVCGDSCRCTIRTRMITRNNSQSQPVPGGEGE